MAVSFESVADIKKEIERVLLEEKSGRRKTPIIIRFLVYMRDELRCAYCGEDFLGRSLLLTLDHVIPKSKGGSFDLSNLVTCCRKCNRRKRDILFCEQFRGLTKTLLWQANRSLLKRLSFSSDVMEILESVLASVTPAKRVYVYWEGQEHAIVEWTQHFVLRNVHTGAYITVPSPCASHHKKGSGGRRCAPNYQHLEKIMELRAVTRADINGRA